MYADVRNIDDSSHSFRCQCASEEEAETHYHNKRKRMKIAGYVFFGFGSVFSFGLSVICGISGYKLLYTSRFEDWLQQRRNERERERRLQTNNEEKNFQELYDLMKGASQNKGMAKAQLDDMRDEIEAAKTLPAPNISRTEYELKDELVRTLRRWCCSALAMTAAFIIAIPLFACGFYTVDVDEFWIGCGSRILTEEQGRSPNHTEHHYVRVYSPTPDKKNEQFFFFIVGTAHIL